MATKYFGYWPMLKTRNAKFSKCRERGLVHDLLKNNDVEVKPFEANKMVVTAVFLGVIVAGLSILDIYLLKHCFGQPREEEDGEAPAFPVTIPYYVFAR